MILLGRVAPYHFSRRPTSAGSLGDIAAAYSNVRFTPQERTLSKPVYMSAKCQQPTSLLRPL